MSQPFPWIPEWALLVAALLLIVGLAVWLLFGGVLRGLSLIEDFVWRVWKDPQDAVREQARLARFHESRREQLAALAAEVGVPDPASEKPKARQLRLYFNKRVQDLTLSPPRSENQPIESLPESFGRDMAPDFRDWWDSLPLSLRERDD